MSVERERPLWVAGPEEDESDGVRELLMEVLADGEM